MKILVIVARGLQASLVGAYGNHWIMTPTLDALAARGILFDACYADHADPGGTRRSWRTGRLDLPVPGQPEVSTSSDLLAALREADVPTMLVHDVSRPLPEAFLQGWAATVEVEPVGDEDPLELAIQGAEQLLEALREETNALVWLDLPTALPPWNVPPDFVAPYFETEELAEVAESQETEGDDQEEEVEEEEEEEEETLDDLEDLYEDDEPPPEFHVQPPSDRLAPEDDHLYLSLRASCAAAIGYLDVGLGQLLESLDRLDPEQKIAVIFTSDHGLPLGEHGVIGTSGAGPHEELLHIPLIVRLPGGERGGRRVAGLCQPIDLAVTLAGLFGIELPEATGRNLLDTTAPDRPYLVSATRQEGRVIWALRTPDWSYVWPAPSVEGEAVPGRLYQQPDDPWEVNDVRQHHLELAEHFEQLLREAVQASRAAGKNVWPELRDEDALLAVTPPESA